MKLGLSKGSENAMYGFFLAHGYVICYSLLHPLRIQLKVFSNRATMLWPISKIRVCSCRVFRNPTQKLVAYIVSEEKISLHNQLIQGIPQIAIVHRPAFALLDQDCNRLLKQIGLS